MIRIGLFGALGIGLSVIAMAQTSPQSDSDLDAAMEEVLNFSFDDADVEEEVVSTSRQTFQQKDTAMLRALDKITGRSTDFEMRVGEPKVYGSLRIDLETCFQTPPEEPPESAAFLKITSATSRQVQTMAEPRDLTEEELTVSEGEDADVRFSGWMYASSPGLNALEHPVYDIWVIFCSAVTPSELAPIEPAE